MVERSQRGSFRPYYSHTDEEFAKEALNSSDPTGHLKILQAKRRKSQYGLLRNLTSKGVLVSDDLVNGVTITGEGKNRRAELNPSNISYLQEHGLVEIFSGFTFGSRSRIFKEAERFARSKAVDLREQTKASWGPSSLGPVVSPSNEDPEDFEEDPTKEFPLFGQETSLIEPAGDKTDDDYDLRRAILRGAIENRELGLALWAAGFRPPAEFNREVTPELTQQKDSDGELGAGVGILSPVEAPEPAQEIIVPEIAEELPIVELAAAIRAEEARVVEPVLVALKDPLSPPTTAQILRRGTRNFRNLAYAAVGVAAGVTGVVLVAYAIAAGVGRSSSSEAQGVSSPVPTGNPLERQTQAATYAASPRPTETPTPQVSVSPTRTPVPGADTTNVETRIAYQLGTKEPNTSTPVPPTATFRVLATLPTGREFVATLTAPTPAELEPTALPTTTPSAAEIPSTQGQQSLMDSPEDKFSLPTTGGESGIPKPVGIAGGLIAAGALWRKWDKLITRRK